jgi:hypothetical protein
MREKASQGLDTVRRELQTLVARGGRITERDLLRVSAQTGIDYCTVVRVQQELS